MNVRAKSIEDEINSLASTIKKNMVEPAGQRLEDIEIRICRVERAITFLNRALWVSGIVFATALGAIIYYLAANQR